MNDVLRDLYRRLERVERLTGVATPTVIALANSDLRNGWVALGGGYAAPRYWKDSLGRVHLEGIVKSGTINTAIFTLPPGFRPATSESFAQIVQSGSGSGSCEVQPLGPVVAFTASNASFSLWGVSFLAEN